MDIATGQRFGYLTVVRRVEDGKGRRARFLVKCACGKSTVVSGTNLRRGLSKACGGQCRKLREDRTIARLLAEQAEYLASAKDY